MSAIRPKSLLTMYDAAEVLRVTPRKLGAMVRDGRIPYIRLPGLHPRRIPCHSEATILADQTRPCHPARVWWD